MAIKTKKITDLGTINISASGAGSLKDSDFFLIGCKSGITGKVQTSDFVTAIEQHAQSLVTSAAEVLAASSIVDVDDVNEMKKNVLALTNNVNDLSATVENLTSIPATVATSSCDCAEKIATLEAKVAALESFVMALQKDGYLTLKEIQRAAADACPICNHTHEEEQAAE